MIYVAFIAVGGCVGFWLGMGYVMHELVTQQGAHLKQMDEIFDEVNRLRAQNAMLIGRENVTG